MQDTASSFRRSLYPICSALGLSCRAHPVWREHLAVSLFANGTQGTLPAATYNYSAFAFDPNSPSQQFA